MMTSYMADLHSRFTAALVGLAKEVEDLRGKWAGVAVAAADCASRASVEAAWGDAPTHAATMGHLHAAATALAALLQVEDASAATRDTVRALASAALASAAQLLPPGTTLGDGAATSGCTVAGTVWVPALSKCLPSSLASELEAALARQASAAWWGAWVRGALPGAATSAVTGTVSIVFVLFVVVCGGALYLETPAAAALRQSLPPAAVPAAAALAAWLRASGVTAHARAGEAAVHLAAAGAAIQSRIIAFADLPPLDGMGAREAVQEEEEEAAPARAAEAEAAATPSSTVSRRRRSVGSRR